jgi:hypothetical protein
MRSAPHPRKIHFESPTCPVSPITNRHSAFTSNAVAAPSAQAKFP